MSNLPRTPWGWRFGPFRGNSTTVITGCQELPLLTRRILLDVTLGGRSLLRLMRHTWHRSDEDRDLHDHPWAFLTWIRGPVGYLEEVPKFHGSAYTWLDERRPGSILFRPARFRHAVRFPTDYVDGTCVSYVLTGPRVRDWGFWSKGRWIPWREYGESRLCE